MGLKLVEHIRRLQGGAQPHLMRASDGHCYVVKFQNNPQGSRILANELLATRLAQLIDLPVPESQVVELPPELSQGLYFETPSGREPILPGLHFGSRLLAPVEGCLCGIYDNPPPAAHDMIRNPDDWIGIRLFDFWTCKTDRRQAVYWRRSQQKKFTVSFIDFGHCFGGTNWDFRRPEPTFPAVGSREFQEWCFWNSRIMSLPCDFIDYLVRAVPDEWHGGSSGIELLSERLRIGQELLWRYEVDLLRKGL